MSVEACRIHLNTINWDTITEQELVQYGGYKSKLGLRLGLVFGLQLVLALKHLEISCNIMYHVLYVTGIRYI